MLRVVALLLAVGAAAACSGEGRDSPSNAAAPPPHAATAQPRLIQRSRPSMGSPVDLSAWTTREADAVAAFEAAFNEFDRLDAPAERLARGQRRRAFERRRRPRPGGRSRDTLAVLQLGAPGQRMDRRQIRRHVRRAGGLWKFDHDQDDRIPTRAADRRRVSRSSTTARSRLDEAAGTARLKRAGVRVHLGGVGKGYAVDRAVAILRSHGLTDFMVQSGGDLYVGGRKGNLPWRLGLRDPRGPADKSLRDAGTVGRHLQHFGRLRALLHAGRRPLPPPARSGHRPARARHPQRDHRRADVGRRRRAVHRRLRGSDPRPEWR